MPEAGARDLRVRQGRGRVQGRVHYLSSSPLSSLLGHSAANSHETELGRGASSQVLEGWSCSSQLACSLPTDRGPDLPNWATQRFLTSKHSTAVAAWSLQSCLTLCDPTDCSPPGSSVYGILQARTLEWVAMPSSRGLSQPRDGTQVSSALQVDSLPLSHQGGPQTLGEMISLLF